MRFTQTLKDYYKNQEIADADQIDQPAPAAKQEAMPKAKEVDVPTPVIPNAQEPKIPKRAIPKKVYIGTSRG